MRKSDRLPLILLIAFAIFWLVIAINPYDRFTWAIENILSVLLVLLLIVTYRMFRFSNTAYILLFSFLILHTLGSYYTYTNMPIFKWIQAMFDFSRNHYDRVVHFLFGLIFYFPIYEIVTRKLKIKGWISYLLPFLIIVSLKTIYEILEYLAVIFTHNLAFSDSFLGMQGDYWDAQKDILFGMAGAAISMVVCWVRKRVNYI